MVNAAWFAVSVQYEIHLIQGKSTVSNRKEIERFLENGTESGIALLKTVVKFQVFNNSW